MPLSKCISEYQTYILRIQMWLFVKDKPENSRHAKSTHMYELTTLTTYVIYYIPQCIMVIIFICFMEVVDGKCLKIAKLTQSKNTNKHR